jgi:hypothetical protein
MQLLAPGGSKPLNQSSLPGYKGPKVTTQYASLLLIFLGFFLIFFEKKKHCKNTLRNEFVQFQVQQNSLG